MGVVAIIEANDVLRKFSSCKLCLNLDFCLQCDNIKNILGIINVTFEAMHYQMCGKYFKKTRKITEKMKLNF